MKRKKFLLFSIICAAGLLLSGCREEAVPEEPVKVTVSFYDGENLLKEKSLDPGAAVGAFPKDGTAWRDESGRFIDPTGLTAEEDVAYYAWNGPELSQFHGVLFEVPGERFYPGDALSRGKAARLAYAMLAEERAGGIDVKITDVKEKSPEYEAIRAVTSLGLMECDEDGAFRPRDPMTQEEFVTLLYRLAGMPGLSGAPGKDWKDAAIECAWERGWIPEGAFVPRSRLSRGTAAEMAALFRGDAVTAEDAALACPESPFTDVSADDPAYPAVLDTAYRNEFLEYVTGTAEDEAPGFVIVGDYLCHVNEETLRLDRFEAGFVTVDGGLYRASQDGPVLDRMPQGLVELDGAMYYVPEADGPFLTDGDFGFLHFGEDGRYTSGDPTVDEKVDELLGEILANDSLSRREKLYRAYCAIRDDGFFYRSRASTGWARGSDYWALYCARVMYTEKGGTCYYWASAFLYAARRVGYQAYAVCGGVGTRNQIHAWVVVIDDDGQEYICDVELEWAYHRGFYSGFYAPTDLFMQPLNATKQIYVFPGRQTEAFYDTYGVSRTESYDDVIYVPPEAQRPPETEEPAETEEPEESAAPDQSPQPGQSPGPSATPAATATPTSGKKPTPTPQATATAAPVVTEAPVVTPEPTPEPTAAPVTPEPVPVTPEPAPDPPAPDPDPPAPDPDPPAPDPDPLAPDPDPPAPDQPGE